MKSKWIGNEEEMQAYAGQLAKHISDGAIIFLKGPLGAGKTTFVRGFLRALGWQGKVKSPTYTLVEPYEIANRQVFHFDLYRIEDPHELVSMGVEEYFSVTSLSFIEWPEKGLPHLPQPDLIFSIDILEKGRKIQIEALTERGKMIVFNGDNV